MSSSSSSPAPVFVVVVCLMTLVATASCGCRSNSNTRIKAVATPVLFTNKAGGGADELQVPQSGSASKLFDAGGQVMAAWYQPYDNILDFPAIGQIDVQPAGNYVNLVARGYPSQRDARVRIKIFAQLQ